MSKKIRAGARAAPTQARPEVSAAPASQPAKEGFGSDELSNGQGTALRVKAMQAVAAVDAPAPFEQFAGYPKTPEERGVSLARIARRFGEALRSAPSGVKAMLQDLKRLGVDDVDVFQGSHTLVDGDNGALYERWKTLGAHPRTAPSSHYRDVPVQQYELDIPGVGVALFGKTLAGQTWFQVEAHTGSDLLHHGVDAGIHFISEFAGEVNHFLRDHGLPAGEAVADNVGPAGLSPNSEKTGRALRVKFVPPPT